MIYLRRSSQLIFFGLFIYLIIRTVDPLTGFIPVNLFFITDPLVAIGTSMAGRTFVITFLSSLVIVITAILLGRVFCGWACPFGTTLDIVSRVIPKRFRRTGLAPSWRKMKYITLVIIIAAAILGVNLVGWLDPISLGFKAYGLLIYSVMDWFGKSTLSRVGLEDTLTPLINTGVFDRNEVTFHGLWLIAALLVVIIILLSFLERRFWCRNLCPLGALLGVFSRWRIFRTTRGVECIKCRLCLKNCKMNIWQPDYSTLDEECIFCYTCVAGCPKRQLTFGRPSRLDISVSILPSRRAFLTGVLTGVAVAPLLKYTISAKENPVLPRLRPPGGVRPEDEFLARCIRCGSCMKVCPANALHPLITEAGIYGLFSPVLIPRIGPCFYECNLCGQVCPSGAIQNLTIEKKKEWPIGLAKTNWDICINCLACEEHCPVPDKAIKETREKGKRYPLVIDEMCIGCGQCEKVCPVEPVAAIRVWPCS